jgi:hypothetical protein
MGKNIPLGFLEYNAVNCETTPRSKKHRRIILERGRGGAIYRCETYIESLIVAASNLMDTNFGLRPCPSNTDEML